MPSDEAALDYLNSLKTRKTEGGIQFMHTDFVRHEKESQLEHTHEIVRMERGATKNSGSPMYRCRTSDGQTVNVFQHSDPVKDGSHLFIDAGYMVDMQALQIGEALEWTGSPIRVEMRKKGDWWEVVAVEARPAGAEADTLWQPDVMVYRRRAQEQAMRLRVMGCRSIDIESTGLKTDDEMISVAIIGFDGDTWMNHRVRPQDISKMDRIGKNGSKASDIHGITAEELADAPNIVDIEDMLDASLSLANIIGYNVRFDLQMIERNLAIKGLPLPIYNAVWDVAQLVAEFIGNWNPKRGWFEMVTLDEACAAFGIERDVKHDALADARDTLALVKAMARHGANRFSAINFAKRGINAHQS